MTKTCLRNLGAILHFTTTRGFIVIRTIRGSSFMRSGRRIRIANIFRIKSYLTEHIPECAACRAVYDKFLDQQKGRNSIADTDKEYLGLGIY